MKITDTLIGLYNGLNYKQQLAVMIVAGMVLILTHVIFIVLAVGSFLLANYLFTQGFSTKNQPVLIASAAFILLGFYLMGLFIALWLI